MPFKLFQRKKQPEPEALAQPVQEGQPEAGTSTQQPTGETTSEGVEQSSQIPLAVTTEQPQEPEPQKPSSEVGVESKVVEQEEPLNKTYLKAMPLKELSDIQNVKADVINGNIIILRITPLAGKSIEDVKTAVNDLFQFAESIGGDIARLGEERVVICPKNIRIWREKTPAPIRNGQPISTVA